MEFIKEIDKILPDRSRHLKKNFKTALDKIINEQNQVDENRLEQEIALLVIKQDIQEELDEARNLREEAQKILAKEKKNLDKAEEESKNLIEKAKQQVDELTKKAEETLKEDIERKKKIAELKIEQAETEALNDVKARVANLSFEITKNYLSKNLDKKVSRSILDDSISEIKKNL